MVSRVYIASDHNGNAARAYVIKRLQLAGIEYVDHGPTESDGKVDYPDLAAKVAWSIILASDHTVRGILICGTGTGMCIAANKHPFIRAGIATDRATAELMREHNDCNVLVLGQWRNSLSQMDEMVTAFLETEFVPGGRHDARLQKISELDKGLCNGE